MNCLIGAVLNWVRSGLQGKIVIVRRGAIPHFGHLYGKWLVHYTNKPLTEEQRKQCKRPDEVTFLDRLYHAIWYDGEYKVDEIHPCGYGYTETRPHIWCAVMRTIEGGKTNWA